MRVTNEGLGSAGDSGAQGESPGLVTVREFCVFTGESGESEEGRKGHNAESQRTESFAENRVQLETINERGGATKEPSGSVPLRSLRLCVNLKGQCSHEVFSCSNHLLRLL